jgi:hypothetical protein
LLQHGGDTNVHIYTMARYFYTGSFAVHSVSTSCQIKTARNSIYPWKTISPKTGLAISVSQLGFTHLVSMVGRSYLGLPSKIL